MFVLKRNQIIITALIVMIAVAGYLNYIDGKSPKSSGITLNDQGEIDALAPSNLNTYDIGSALTTPQEEDNPSIATSGASSQGNVQTSAGANEGSADNGGVPASGNNVTAAASDTSELEPGSAVFVNTQQESSYFVTLKLDREQARSKVKDLFMEKLNSTNATDADRQEASAKINEIAKWTNDENKAEASIKSKGFSEVYVNIDENNVDVIVNKDALTDAELAKIEDIIKRTTGMTVDKIQISTMRK